MRIVFPLFPSHMLSVVVVCRVVMVGHQFPMLSLLLRPFPALMRPRGFVVIRTVAAFPIAMIAIVVL